MSKFVTLHGFGGGGGVDLNFDIKAYGSEEEMLADTPLENTIGVITNTPITGYRFSGTEPENMNNGEVWIAIGVSNAKFEIIDGVSVSPIYAKQMISGALVDVTAKSYQNGEWVEWITYIYKTGDNESAFYVYEPSGSYAGQVSTVFDSDGISLKNTYTDGVYGVRIATYGKIDFANYSKLYAKVMFNSIGGGTSLWTGFGVTPDRSGQTANYLAITEYVDPSVGEHIYGVRLSGVDTSGYVEYVFDATTITVDAKIISIWLE